MSSNRVLLPIDLLFIALAAITALALRENFEITTQRWLDCLPHVALTLVAAVPILGFMRINRSIWRLTAMGDYLRLAVASVLIVVAALAVGFILNRLDGLPRSLPIIQIMLTAVALVGLRIAAREWHLLRKPAPVVLTAMPGASQERDVVLVVGLNRITELYLTAVSEFAADRISIAGVLGRSGQHTGRLVHQHPVLGTPEQLVAVLRDLEVRGIFVTRIVVTSLFKDLSPIAQAALLAIERSSAVKLQMFAETMLSDDGPRLKSTAPNRPSKRDNSVFWFSQEELALLGRKPYWKMKRAIDIVGSTVLIIICLPFWLLVAGLVAVDVGFPVMFWQQRPGIGGRPFKLHKFRTMRAAYDEHGVRLSDSDRLSSIGRLLRRVRLDELPQLFHILIGEMSFIGPRPLLPADQPATFAARLVVRPGLSGWAQVVGGRDITTADKAALDVWYVKNASLVLDLEIVLRTIAMLVRGDRANVKIIDRAWQDLQAAGVCEAAE